MDLEGAEDRVGDQLRGKQCEGQCTASGQCNCDGVSN